MKIGIDIDDTICNTNEYITELALQYDKEYLIGKGFKNKDAYYFTDMFYWNNIDKDNFMRYFNEIDGFNKMSVKSDAIYYINKLCDEGYNITFITYRHGLDNDKIEKSTKDLLDSNKIKYNKLICNSGPKGIVCEKESIDLFIDDSINQVSDVLKHNIKCLLFDTPYNKKCNYKRVYNWKEIYDYVKENS